MSRIDVDPPLFVPGEQQVVKQSELVAPPDASRATPTSSVLTHTGYLVRDRQARIRAEPGVDWSTRTVREAQAARLTTTTLCSDGYYVPGC